jgi:hypothetical protein
MCRSGLVHVLVLFWLWLPAVAIAVLLGVAFGWQVPLAFALGCGFVAVIAARPERKVGEMQAAMEFIGLALLGGVVGGLLFGGLGAIFGFVLGFTARLSEVPVTRGPSFRFARRWRS